MKLYFSPGACSLAPRIIINEIGLACEYEKVDLHSKKTATGKDFLTINPKGSVPVIEFEDHKILTENAIILQYLADSNNAISLLSPTSDFKRYRILEWLNYVATELHKTVGALFNPKLYDAAKEVYTTIIRSKCDFVNRNLAKNVYLAGEDFTLPDAYLFIVIRWLVYFKFELNEWENIKRYYEELKNRKSIKQSLTEENLV